MSLSSGGSVNPSTPTFGNINLPGETVNLISVENSVSNGWNNLYLHPKPFKSMFKPNSYLMSIRCPGLVNPSVPTFLNINLTKTIRNLLLASKITKKWLQESIFPPLYLYELEIISYVASLSRRGPVNMSAPTFYNINLTETMTKLLDA